jgi:hypothetical protein
MFQQAGCQEVPYSLSRQHYVRNMSVETSQYFSSTLFRLHQKFCAAYFPVISLGLILVLGVYRDVAIRRYNWATFGGMLVRELGPPGWESLKRESKIYS